MTEVIQTLLAQPLQYGVFSNGKGDAVQYKQIRFRALGTRYQFERYTEKQVFHNFCEKAAFGDELAALFQTGYRQLDAWDGTFHYTVKVSKKGKYTLLKQKDASHAAASAHNREKQYILKEGEAILPLVDLGVFTKEGRVVHSMYDKFRQINRFTELVRDGLDAAALTQLRVLDFGCGKSYLTFILYHYLVHVRNMDAEITGLDLKADVIQKCNALAEKYGYEKLHFAVGDIEGFSCSVPPDMVITLHACDTATDAALFHAVQWQCRLIYSVPCCQHELNAQIESENFSLLTRYGLIKERFSALATDAIRGALLEACGYHVQMVEFVDFAHSPKNLLIRAVRRAVPMQKRLLALDEAERLMKEFSFRPTLYRKLKEADLLPKKT